MYTYESKKKKKKGPNPTPPPLPLGLLELCICGPAVNHLAGMFPSLGIPFDHQIGPVSNINSYLSNLYYQP